MEHSNAAVGLGPLAHRTFEPQNESHVKLPYGQNSREPNDAQISTVLAHKSAGTTISSSES